MSASDSTPLPLAKTPAAEADRAETAEGSAGQTREVTAIGDLRRNTLVSVHGRVQAVTDEDEFTLVDGTGSVTVWTGGVLFSVDNGDVVSVRGFVDDDWVLELTAHEIIRADGTVITIDTQTD